MGISATEPCWLFCFFPDLGSVLPIPDLLCALGLSPMGCIRGSLAAGFSLGSHAGNPAGREGKREGGLLQQVSMGPGGRTRSLRGEAWVAY